MYIYTWVASVVSYFSFLYYTLFNIFISQFAATRRYNNVIIFCIHTQVHTRHSCPILLSPTTHTHTPACPHNNNYVKAAHTLAHIFVRSTESFFHGVLHLKPVCPHAVNNDYPTRIYVLCIFTKGLMCVCVAKRFLK